MSSDALLSDKRYNGYILFILRSFWISSFYDKEFVAEYINFPAELH